MTYLYKNKYHRFWASSDTSDPLDPYVCLPLTLATPILNANIYLPLPLATHISSLIAKPTNITSIIFH